MNTMSESERPDRQTERWFPTRLPAPGTRWRVRARRAREVVLDRSPSVAGAGRGAAGGRLRAGVAGRMAAPRQRGPGDGRRVNDLSPGDVAGRLRVLLDAIEAGEFTADLDYTAYLRGAADTLAMVADQR